jgi:putative oxidoreductase
MNVGLLLLRIVVGGTLALHGSQKVFGAFRGPGIRGVHGMVEHLGVRPARPLALLLSATELVGGLLLVLGLLTPLAAAAVGGAMFSAVRVVHWEHGFFATEGGFELPLALGGGAIALAFTGPARYSLDHAFGWHLAGNGWGVAAAVVALAASVVIVALGHRLVFQRHRGALPA